MDLLLDRESHDMVFINGACPVTQEKRNIVAQRLKITLATFLGEWFLDRDLGVPYVQRIFGKQPDLKSVDVIFQTKILETFEVSSILYYYSTLDINTRVFSLTFRVVCTNGTATDEITLNMTPQGIV